MLQVKDSGKHSSLPRHEINYDRKKFCSTDLEKNCFQHFLVSKVKVISAVSSTQTFSFNNLQLIKISVASKIKNTGQNRWGGIFSDQNGEAYDFRKLVLEIYFFSARSLVITSF
jgi:hypothetical protein